MFGVCQQTRFYREWLTFLLLPLLFDLALAVKTHFCINKVMMYPTILYSQNKIHVVTLRKSCDHHKADMEDSAEGLPLFFGKVFSCDLCSFFPDIGRSVRVLQLVHVHVEGHCVCRR